MKGLARRGRNRLRKEIKNVGYGGKRAGTFLFRSADDGGENGHEFVGFLLERRCQLWVNPAFLTQEFKPHLAFVRLLRSTSQL